MSKDQSNKPDWKRILFWAAVLVAVWAPVPMLAKLGAGQMNGFEMTFWINLFALPVVTLWVLPREHRARLVNYSGRTLGMLAGIGFLGNLLYQILYFASYQTITAITGSVMVRLGGILFVVASMLILGEKHSKAYIAAVVLATVGAVLPATRPGMTWQLSLTTGFWLMILATLLNTAYQFANNHVKTEYDDVRANLFVYKASTFVVILGWAILTQLPSVGVGPRLSVTLKPRWADLVFLFYLGAFADGIGFLAFLELLSAGGSARATIASTLVTVPQILLAICVLHEPASFVNAILAPALVIIPAIIAVLLDQKARNGTGVDSG